MLRQGKGFYYFTIEVHKVGFKYTKSVYSVSLNEKKMLTSTSMQVVSTMYDMNDLI